ncbi:MULTISPECIES: hypothetical protein [Eubacteriales]|uniref:Hydrolase n=1 Tax=Bittarella massiliensis (ex Durand et al. 2017) TaxID=1720313 RepID=A0AAQ1RUS4_9FIRM|nr:hypothetical protein [Bittarella massiliensis (ex Durand et al. 2017)]ERI99107.1 HDIG domain protein [Clostridium sp. ATCC 29733]MZL70172.1 hydrolase [Bittarella massiliensis (ex Durand et al. 2017)]MZL81124.1 hydrolase [Bittarella massiliensis (ex Durand et al. 2017)]SHF64085.1 Predicted hydrolase, HD superfamily [Bittarella massiliensis (ex Durand et al. 2017)]
MVPNLQQARDLLKKYNSGEFHLLHGEVVSGIMGYFARRDDPQNEEYWASVGMLHDIDFERYPEEHCAKCVEILRAHSVDEGMIRSIVSHGYGRLNWVTVKPEQKMEKILFATDELSGLIGACAMVRPSKSVRDMEVSSIKKKFKKKEFAAGCCREDMVQGAEMLGISLEELMQQTLDAMKTLVDVLPV